MTVPRYEPMLATPWPGPFDDPDWVHELKWDGVRIIATWTEGTVSLRSRRGNVVTSHYPEIPADLPEGLVLDGEIVALDDAGLPSFARLQRRMHVASPGVDLTAAVPVSFAIFDILHHEAPLVDRPWRERRRRLEGIELPSPLALTDVTPHGVALFEAVRERGLEGTVAKRADSPYRPGRRSPDWRKVASRRTIRAVVGGFLPGEGGRASTFGSLVLGLHVGGGLRYVGSVGSGFDDAALRAIRGALDEMETSPPPFVETRPIPSGVRWVAPRLVAVVEFKEWTPEGRLRAPVFRGFAPDPPEEVTWAAEGPRAN